MKSFLGLEFPVFMPDATLGAVRTVTTDQLEETGTEMVVVNTFHLMLMYGVEQLSELGGIAKLMNWSGKVLSDSGGFQVYSLIHQKPEKGKVTQYGAYFTSPRDGKKLSLTPESSIDMQIAIGSDVLIVLDDCRHSDLVRREAEQSVFHTTLWAKRAKEHLENTYPQKASEKKLFAVVQGGEFKDLREKSVEELMEIGFDGYCFGGWPIDDKGTLTEDILAYTAELLPDDVPKYAMGIGTPWDIEKCYAMGYQMFDCVIPTRNARHGLLYTNEGVVRITKTAYADDESPVDATCSCMTCKNYSRAYLHHLFRAKESIGKTLATIHNLTHYVDLMKKLRNTEKPLSQKHV